jgi:hypothetical protein
MADLSFKRRPNWHERSACLREEKHLDHTPQRRRRPKAIESGCRARSRSRNQGQRLDADKRLKSSSAYETDKEETRPTRLRKKSARVKKRASLKLDWEIGCLWFGRTRRDRNTRRKFFCLVEFGEPPGQVGRHGAANIVDYVVTADDVC